MIKLNIFNLSNGVKKKRHILIKKYRFRGIIYLEAMRNSQLLNSILKKRNSHNNEKNFLKREINN